MAKGKDNMKRIMEKRKKDMLFEHEVRKYFKKLYKQKIFSTDKTGQKTIEMVPASFVADEEIIFVKENKKYLNNQNFLIILSLPHQILLKLQHRCPFPE